MRVVFSLTDFCENNAIANVDLIKMDIEGAEFPASLGVEMIIQRFVPNLCICIYHKISDLVDIDLFLRSLDLGYKIYVAHHTWTHNGFVLYAVPDRYR